MTDLRSQNTAILDKATGEDITSKYCGVLSKTEKERWEFLRKEEDKKIYKRLAQNERGYFTMLKYEVGKCLDLGISISNVTRVMYLSTYMGYNNELRDLGNHPLTKKKMRELLNVTYPTFAKFYEECESNNIFEYKDGLYYMNKTIFKRGEMSRKEKAAQNTMFLYFSGIRSLYESATTSEHKTLSYLFLMLPYANRKFNVLCKYPDEENANNVECLTWDEICDLFDIAGKKDLRRRITSLKVDGKKAIVWLGKGVASFKSCCFFINTQIYYTGLNWDAVELLQLHCRLCGVCRDWKEKFQKIAFIQRYIGANIDFAN